MIDKRRFRAQMALHGDTLIDLSQALGFSSQSQLSHRIDEVKGYNFRAKEIEKIRDRYNLTPQDISDIFFAS
jgi:hypothetical protein